MFVQSHIQRHHHHQHHNSNSNNHQHNHNHNNTNNTNNNHHHHQNHNIQQHSHSQHQKHHNAPSSSLSLVTHSSSNNNKRLANTSNNNISNKVSSLTNNKSTTSIHSLRASSDKLSHIIGIGEAEKVQLVGEVVNSATLLFTKHDRNSNKHKHHENKFNLGANDGIIQNKSEERVKSSTITQTTTTRCENNRNPTEFSSISNAFEDDYEIVYESNSSNLFNSDAGIGTKISTSINLDELHLLRDRTRSLGSHKSLRIYDLMPNNTRLRAQVESATVVSHCEPNSGRGGGGSIKSGSTSGGDIINTSAIRKDLVGIHAKSHQHQISSSSSSTLRLAQTVSLEGTSDTSCHNNNNNNNRFKKNCHSRRLIDGGEPRRAFSDVSERSSSFWKFFTGSQQLLSNIFVDSSCWLAGKFSSSSSHNRQLSAQQLSSAFQSTNHNHHDHDHHNLHHLHHHHRRQSLGIVRSFCMSFIGYQLETCRLLANDLAAREKQRTTVNQSTSIDSSLPNNCFLDDFAKDLYDPLNQISSMSSEAGEFAQHQQYANLNGHHHHHHHQHQHDHHRQQQQQQQQQQTNQHQLRGRMFHSLDRPTLERQREVNFDENDNDGFEEEEPIIRIPTIFKEPLPPQQIIQSSFQQLNGKSQICATKEGVFTHHQQNHLHHKHRHHHYNTQNPSIHQNQNQFQMMNQFDANYDSLNFNDQIHHDDNSKHQQNMEFDYGLAAQTELANIATNQQQQEHISRASRAKFYLGQHSLDRDIVQVILPSSHLNSAGTNHGPVMLKKREDEFFSHNFHHETWNNRPFREEDFRSPSGDSNQEQREEEEVEEEDDDDEGESGSRSNSNNCDQYDLKQEISNTINQLSIGMPNRATRKRKTLKKSSSPISFDGARRRLGLRRKGEMNQLNSICVQRSEEVIPTGVRHLSRQTTFNSLCDSGTENGSFWHAQSQLLPDPRAKFIEGIGFGQIASRQALVSPNLGDIQLSLSSRRGMLEVEIIRARGLHAKAGSKSLPSPYVKVYLMKEKKCIAKCRTHQVNQTLDPLYQEPFVFRNEFKNCVLQVIIWGDYGKRDRKSMMGVVQIHLDDLDISNMVIGWYKLFNIPSMTNSLASSKILRQRLLHHSSSISECPLNT